MTSLRGSGVRFAPSPSGPFHIGNLRTAWVSKQIATALREPWVIRVEDIDTPRVVPGAWEQQREDLSSLGLVADTVVIQSSRHSRHLELFEKARQQGQVYPCDCSRREVLESLAQMARAPHATAAEYSGHCRHRDSASLADFHPAETLAWRWKSTDASGHHDAIVARTDAKGANFVPGYHWACAADDADGMYRVLVRAWDLAMVDRLQREIRLWVSSGVSDPIVFHTALVVRADGGRLEKRTQGVTLAEALALEISNEQLIENFRESFNLESALAHLDDGPKIHTPGNLIGENEQKCPVARFLK